MITVFTETEKQVLVQLRSGMPDENHDYIGRVVELYRGERAALKKMILPMITLMLQIARIKSSPEQLIEAFEKYVEKHTEDLVRRCEGMDDKEAVVMTSLAMSFMQHNPHVFEQIEQ